MKRWIVWGALLLLLGSPQISLALRCDSKIIDTGDTMFRVQKYCGEPDARVFVGEQKFREYSPYEGTTVSKQQVWDWYYDRGHNKFTVRLRFRGGILVAIFDEGRG